MRVAAAGVCHSDLHLADGHLGDGRHPMVLGHEGAGVVEALGEGVERARRRATGSPSASCRRAAPAALSRAGGATSARRRRPRSWAGTLLDGSSRLRLPGRSSRSSTSTSSRASPSAASCPPRARCRSRRSCRSGRRRCSGCGVVTAVGAVRNAARVAVGETVCVIGCGGVGLQLVAAARLAGAARIIAVERDDGEAGAGAGARRDRRRPGRVADDAAPACWRSRRAASITRSRPSARRRRSASPGTCCARARPRRSSGSRRPASEVALPALELLSEKGIRGSYYGSGDAAALLAAMARMTAAGDFPVADVVTHVTGPRRHRGRVRAAAGGRGRAYRRSSSTAELAGMRRVGRPGDRGADPLERAVVAELERRRERPRGLLCDLVAFDTRAPDPDYAPRDEAALQEYVAGRMRAAGLAVRVWEPEPADAAARTGTRSPTAITSAAGRSSWPPPPAPAAAASLLFNGHVDVVTVEPRGALDERPVRARAAATAVCTGAAPAT